MGGICKNYLKKEICNFNDKELKFIKNERLIRLIDLEVSNISNMMYETIIDKNEVFNILQEIHIINKVLLEKLESNKK